MPLSSVVNRRDLCEGWARGILSFRILSCGRNGKLCHEILDSRAVASMDGDLNQIEQGVDALALRRAPLPP